MATAVLSSVPTIIDLGESTTGWGGDTFTLEPDDKVQGNNSVGCAQTNNGTNDIYFQKAAGSWDFSGGEHLRLPFKNTMIGTYGQNEANNGIQVFLYDGTNTAYYTVGGSDTYSGGWHQLVLNTAATATSGSVTMTAVTRIGIRINTHSKPRNVPANMWLDAWYYGDGYTVTGGTSGDEIDWSHIAALDKTNYYGIVIRLDDIYFLAGDVKIGSGATTTYFKSGQKVQFKDLPVNSTLYQVLFQGSACNVDISGGTYGAAGTQDYKFDASDTNINSFVMGGVQFEKASAFTFASGQDVQTCVFNNCGQVVTGNCTFKFNDFSNYAGTTAAVLFPADDTNISDLSFSNCKYGVLYSAVSDSSSPTFKNFVFDDVGGYFDVNNTSGGAVTINLTGTSNANSYTGSTVTFNASVTLTFTVKNEAGTVLQYARINIVNASTKAELYQIETNSSGIATQSHTYAGDLGIEGWVRQMDLTGDDYVPKDFSGTIKSTGFDSNITLIQI